MDQNKDERTQVVDLNLASSDPQFRVASASGQSVGAAFDLGSGQHSAGVGNGAQSMGVGNSGFNSAGSGSAFGDTSQNMPTIGFQNVFTQDVKMVKQQKLSPVVQVVAAVLLMFFMLVGVAWYSTGDLVAVLSNPYELVNIFGFQSDEEGVTPDGGANAAALAAAKAALPVASPDNRKKYPVGKDMQSQEISIWSQVKNELGGELPQRGANLSADQEATFKAGLTHEFNYQRYKTVLDLAAINAPGSEELLRQALESKKFWIRMRALIALADMGEELSDDDVRDALGNAHSELRARFFKRFEKSPCSVGCFYVARAALKHLDPRGREQALKVVSRESSDIRDVYLVAATFDGHEMVQKTAQNLISTRSVNESVWQDVKTRYGLAH